MSKLNLKYNSIQNDINELKADCDTLDLKEIQNRIEKLESGIEKLYIGVNKADNDTKSLRQYMVEMYPNIITSIYQKLEDVIIRKIAGQRYKIYYIRNISELFKDTKYVEKCNNYLEEHNLTIEHINILDEIIKKSKILQLNRRDIIFGKDFSFDDALNNSLMTFKDLSIIVAEYDANITTNNIGSIIDDLYKLMDYYHMD
jgi:hypothetical protein